MQNNSLTSDINSASSDTIFCPILSGLNAEQSDCAALIPSGNANGLLIENLSKKENQKIDQVALLCTDPFINKEVLFADLFELGVRSVTNWPSSIFLDQSFSKAMTNIKVSPADEFECLSHAMKSGLDAKAFILSLYHGRKALSLGIRNLIVHPGLKVELSEEAKSTLYESIHLMIETLIAMEPSVKIYIYQHSAEEVSAHKIRYKDSLLKISGYVVYETSV